MLRTAGWPAVGHDFPFAEPALLDLSDSCLYRQPFAGAGLSFTISRQAKRCECAALCRYHCKGWY